MLDIEKFLHPDLSKFDNDLTASTYVPFDNYMLTLSILVNHLPRIRVLLYENHSGNNNNPEQYDCSINWPRNIYVFHIQDKEIFGVPFVMIPGFNINKIDMELLWLKCTILCHFKSFWKIVNSKVSPF